MTEWPGPRVGGVHTRDGILLSSGGGGAGRQPFSKARRGEEREPKNSLMFS